MSSDNYKKHEDLYKELRKSGASGWGAESFPKRMEGWSKTLEWALPFFPKAPARILDIGCGAGDSALPLARLGYQIAGLDLSQTAIDWAKEKFASHNLVGDFKVWDLTKDEGASWPAKSFDVIVDSATLHCVLPPDREKAFAHIRNLLNNDGIFLLSSMVGEPKDLIKLEFYDPVARLQRVKGLPLRYTPRLEDLKNEVSSYGFLCVTESIQENPWWDHYTAILKL